MRSVNISEKVNKAIVKHVKKKFNFSHWVEKAYIKEFLNESELKKKIKQNERTLKELKAKLIALENQDVDYNMGFTEQEKRFLVGVAIKVEAGYDLKAFNKVFNKNFSRDLEIAEFETAVKYFDEKEGKKK